MKLLTFRKGGIHPPENKEKTQGLAIETMPPPAELAILLNQHIGKPADAVVRKGDLVEKGQVIGEVKDGLGTYIHAPCSGRVRAIDTAPHPIRITAPAIILTPEKEDVETQDVRKRDWSGLTVDELLDIIHHAGIVGAGGAGFPAHVKLRPPKDARITELVINGAECEPYLTADHRVMLEQPEQVVEGIRIMMKILGVSRCLVGIENNKPDAIGELRRHATDGIEICALQTKYPQGSEKQLVYALTGRVIGSGALPASVGVVVQNVSSAVAVQEAVVFGRPMTERVMTVSGGGIRRPANLRVRVGTRIRDIVEYLGGLTGDVKKVILGGPMMGFATADLDSPVTKTTSGILFLTSDEVDLSAGGPCVRCGWCLDACPMGLEPKEIALYVEAGRGKETKPFGVLDCFECGSCAYVCPSRRPLVQFIRLAKQEVRNHK